MPSHPLAPEHDRSLLWRAGALLIPLAVMWLVQLFRWLVPAANLAGWGIIPRSSAGIPGILVAPFIHGSWQHLMSNSIPFAILGALILVRGVNEYLLVLQISVLVAGGGTWVFGTSGTNHIGASGLVFAFTAFLVFRSVLERTIASAVIAIGVALFFGGALVAGLVPREGVSWTGHLFGLLGGVGAAWYLRDARPRRPSRRDLNLVAPDLPPTLSREEEAAWLAAIERQVREAERRLESDEPGHDA